MATSSGILAALSASSSSNIVLGDQIASTAISNNQVPSSSALDGGSNTDDNGNEDGNSGSKNKDPFLNGAGEGSGQNGKVIGGTVGGIIVAIIIVVVVVWLLGKVSCG